MARIPKMAANTPVYDRATRSCANHARGGNPMRVTSSSAARCSSSNPAYMSPPPGSTASTIWSSTSSSTRKAWAWTVNTLGIETWQPLMNGTAPSHTSSAFS